MRCSFIIAAVVALTLRVRRQCGPGRLLQQDPHADRHRAHRVCYRRRRGRQSVCLRGRRHGLWESRPSVRAGREGEGLLSQVRRSRGDYAHSRHRLRWRPSPIAALGAAFAADSPATTHRARPPAAVRVADLASAGIGKPGSGGGIGGGWPGRAAPTAACSAARPRLRLGAGLSPAPTGSSPRYPCAPPPFPARRCRRLDLIFSIALGDALAAPGGRVAHQLAQPLRHDLPGEALPAVASSQPHWLSRPPPSSQRGPTAASSISACVSHWTTIEKLQVERIERAGLDRAVRLVAQPERRGPHRPRRPARSCRPAPPRIVHLDRRAGDQRHIAADRRPPCPSRTTSAERPSSRTP